MANSILNATIHFTTNHRLTETKGNKLELKTMFTLSPSSGQTLSQLLLSLMKKVFKDALPFSTLTYILKISGLLQYS